MSAGTGLSFRMKFYILENSMAKQRTRPIGRALNWGAVLTLIAAYAVGYTIRNREILPLLFEQAPEAAAMDKIRDHPLVLASEAPGQGPEAARYYTIGRAQGWGGPLSIGLCFNEEGRILQVLVLDHNETLPFYYRLEKKEFFEQFESRHVSEPLWPGEDVDTVTQATVSSEAFTEAIRQGSHVLGREIFGLELRERQPRWRIGWNEGMLVLLFVGAGISFLGRLRMVRYLVMAAAFFFLGFHLNASLSIGHFGSVLLGYVPHVVTHPFWWILVCGALLAAIILKRNLYCHALCPLGSLQELNSRISGSNLPVARGFIRVARALPYALTWLALIFVFLTSSPTSGAYEPFPTLFGLEGMEIQWLILASVILGSLFIKRFFCRFFCPVGIVLDLIVRARCRLGNLRKEKTECP